MVLIEKFINYYGDNMNDIKIGIATHKAYQMPEEKIYEPIQCGAAINQENFGYAKDNSKNNISVKNPNYCELTALYWLWKNTNAEYKGLVHYRRHFSKKKYVNMFSCGKFEDILDKNTLEAILANNDIILPNLRNYYIETIESHYKHTHYEQDLVVTRNVLTELYPEYLKSYDKVLKRKSAHMFNMFIMKNDCFEEYCKWLFTILFEVEKQLDISTYSVFHQRVFGRISEILLDVWLDYRKLNFVEIPIIFMEKQNWKNKIFKFFKAKIKKEKY